MTAKEALHAWIDEMTDEDAEELLARLEWEATEEDELTPDEIASAEAGFDEIQRGDFVDGKQLLRRIGLWQTGRGGTR